MKIKSHAALALLLLVLISFAYAGGHSFSQSGTAQPQATQSSEQVAGFDNPIYACGPGSEVFDLLRFGMLGFMSGAMIVFIQTVRQRAVPTTIVLNL